MGIACVQCNGKPPITVIITNPEYVTYTAVLRQCIHCGFESAFVCHDGTSSSAGSAMSSLCARPQTWLIWELSHTHTHTLAPCKHTPGVRVCGWDLTQILDLIRQTSLNSPGEVPWGTTMACSVNIVYTSWWNWKSIEQRSGFKFSQNLFFSKLLPPSCGNMCLWWWYGFIPLWTHLSGNVHAWLEEVPSRFCLHDLPVVVRWL